APARGGARGDGGGRGGRGRAGRGGAGSRSRGRDRRRRRGGGTRGARRGARRLACGRGSRDGRGRAGRQGLTSRRAERRPARLRFPHSPEAGVESGESAHEVVAPSGGSVHTIRPQPVGSNVDGVPRVWYEGRTHVRLCSPNP